MTRMTVRPPADNMPHSGQREADDEGWENIADSQIEPAVNRSDTEADGDIVDIDDDTFVQSAKAMPEPILPSKSVIDAHNLTHWPQKLVSALRRSTET